MRPELPGRKKKIVISHKKAETEVYMQELVQDIWCTRNSKERPYTWRLKSPLFRDDWIFGWLVIVYRGIPNQLM